MTRDLGSSGRNFVMRALEALLHSDRCYLKMFCVVIDIVMLQGDVYMVVSAEQ